MEWFNSLVISVCTSSICFGVLYIICPDGKMSKSVKYVFSLCFLLIIISAAGISIKEAELDFDFQNESEIDVSEGEIAIAGYVYSTALEKSGIDFYSIDILTDNSLDDGISISKIIVYTECSKDKVITAFSGIAENIEVEVINE